MEKQGLTEQQGGENESHQNENESYWNGDDGNESHWNDHFGAVDSVVDAVVAKNVDTDDIEATITTDRTKNHSQGDKTQGYRGDRSQFS